MGRYTGAKGRINRRLGAVIYEDNGAIKALERRSYPPGMHTRRGKQSNYGLGLAEKQKIKYYYGLREGQLRLYFDMANRREGNTGEQLLIICERRLDNVIRRAGLTRTRPMARQGVVHCHFRVNDIKTNKPSFLVRPGDVITVRNKPALQNLYRQTFEDLQAEPIPWVHVEPEKLRITVLGYPGPSDVSLPVETGRVIEFLSR